MFLTDKRVNNIYLVNFSEFIFYSFTKFMYYIYDLNEDFMN
jgi:hypothetical protein